MRIIGGKFRGRKLISPSGREVRPTSDMAKQGIFNVLQFDIEGSRFVDLFSGSGAIGIEALSRGASEVVFCDNEHDSDEKCATPDGFELAKSRKYGRITVDYFVRAARICALTGSFDPFTIGHRMLAEEAQKRYGKVVVVVAINDAKQGLFSLKERAEIARLSTADMPGVTVEICSGMVWEFCKERGIKTIVRGWRDAQDLAYERDMAAFNLEHGGIETVLIEAKGELADIHSHTVRELLESGGDIDDRVVPAAAQTIKQTFERTRRKV